MKLTILFVVICVIAAVKSNLVHSRMADGRPALFSKVLNGRKVPVVGSMVNKPLPIQKRDAKDHETPEIEDLTEEPENNLETTETPENSQSDEEKLYELTLTIEKPWLNDYTTKTSEAFSKLSQQIDIALGSLVENEVSTEVTVPVGTFYLLNVVPSTLDGYLFVVIAFQLPNEVKATSLYEKLETMVLIKGALYDIGAKLLGNRLSEVDEDDLRKFKDHVDCEDLSLCRPTKQAVETTTQPLESSDEDETKAVDEIPNHSSEIDGTCSPKDTIRRGSTSIYIFDDQKCVNQVRNGKILSNCGGKKENNEVSEEEKSSSDEDDMEAAPSEHHEHVVRPNNDDEIVLVVRKKGNKVFIEF